MAGLKYFSVLFVCTLFGTSLAFKADEPDNCLIDNYDSVDSVVKNCKNITVGNVNVPAGKTLNLDLQTGTYLSFTGTITWEYESWNGPLISITGDSLNVDGLGKHSLDGRGELWWDGLGSDSTKQKPLLLQVKATNSRFRSISVKDCPQQCVRISESENLRFQNWVIDTSNGDEKGATNTDGFVIYSSQYVSIQGGSITNQNDCICIYEGAHNVVENVECYNGEGLAFAAGLATEYSGNTIFNTTYKDCYLTRTKSGVHVKTTPGDYKGEISNVTYQNIKLRNVKGFGIKIEQDFVNGASTGEPQGNILIQDLMIYGVHGTVSGPDSVGTYILCGPDGCLNWSWGDIDFTGSAKPNSCNFQPGGFDC